MPIPKLDGRHVLAPLVIALAGCQSAPIAGSVVASNEAQEDAANKLLVLNIARAHERMPMHFSLIGQLRSGPGGWAYGVPSLGLSVPFGGAATPSYGLTLGADGQTPADVSPLSNQEFMRGMTKMLDPELMAYFAKLGWPTSMLLHLFIESIDVVNEDGVVTDRLVNMPTDKNFARFEDFVNAASSCELVADEDRVDTFYSTKARAISPKEAADAKVANLVVLAVDADEKVTKDKSKIAGYRLAAVTKAPVLRFVALPGEANGKTNQCRTGPRFNGVGRFDFTGEPTQDDPPVSCEQKKPEEKKLEERKVGEKEGEAGKNTGSNKPIIYMQTMRQVATKSLGQEERRAGAQACPPPAPKFTAQFVTRSPQGIIYYLGELSRAQNATWKVESFQRPLTIGLPSNEKAILFQMRNAAHDDAAITVRYAGQTFSVPKFSGGAPGQLQDRSVMTLSLLMMVIGLQDKGMEAPTVNNVRVLR